MQASVGFDQALRQAGAVEQVAQLQKLAQALDKVKHLDMAGIHIIIGEESQQHIDGWGNLWLPASASALSWSG